LQVAGAGGKWGFRCRRCRCRLSEEVVWLRWRGAEMDAKAKRCRDLIEVKRCRGNHGM